MIVVWFLLVAAACGAMYWASFRVEPHWVSKEGTRFLCNAEPITLLGEREGKPRETRVMVLPNGLLQLDQRRRLRRRITETWTVIGKSPDPPARRQVYVLRPLGEDGSMGQMALRLPSSSRAVPVLDELIARGGPVG